MAPVPQTDIILPHHPSVPWPLSFPSDRVTGLKRAIVEPETETGAEKGRETGVSMEKSDKIRKLLPAIFLSYNSPLFRFKVQLSIVIEHNSTVLGWRNTKIQGKKRSM